MKLIKVLGFVALGIGVLVLGGIVLGLVTSLLHVLIPLAVLAAIGWVVWKVASSAGSSRPASEARRQEAKEPAAGALPAAKTPSATADAGAAAATPDPGAAAKPDEYKPLSDAEAARIFEEHRKKLT